MEGAGSHHQSQGKCVKWGEDGAFIDVFLLEHNVEIPDTGAECSSS